jgi:glycosyltransferase involved in cell wall biosynthesis
MAITTNTGGIAEVMLDGRTGFIAEAPMIHLLDKAMERAWKQRNQWQDMGKFSAKHIRDLIPEDPVGEFIKKIIGHIN